jgi:acyl-CoA synthetase (AMP-forming)/AMP-acid ligase II
VDSIKALEQIVGKGKVTEGLGMTEGGVVLIANPIKNPTKLGTVGIPFQSTYVKLVDLNTGTKEVPFGKEGEIIVRGPQLFKCYHNKPEETVQALREFQGKKWLYTGDVAKMDEDGYFTIVDRTKDMINVSGYKVFSREVEDTLYEHPAIESCGIVGMPDPERPGSELVKVIIQLSNSHKDKDRAVLEQQIIEYCSENMAAYKRPKNIEFVDQLPLTSVGKVDKKVLRSSVKEG